jgi:hypothetical protein
VKAVQLSAHWWAGATPVWIGIQAFEEPGRPAMSLDEFARVLESVRRGSAGVACSSFASLFSLADEGASPINMPPGAADLVRRFGMGLRLAPATPSDIPGPQPQPAAASDNKNENGTALAEIDVEARSGQSGLPRHPLVRALGPWALAGSGFVVAALTLLLVLRLRPQHRSLADVAEFPLSALEALAVEPVIRGDQAILVTQRLQTLDPSEIDRIHSDGLLLRIHGAGGTLPVGTGDEPGTAPFMAGCAVRAGFVRDAGGLWQLTPAGSDRLRTILADRSDRTWVQFVEDRLHESLLVTCPGCGSSQRGHWLCPNLACTKCHRRIALRESPTVMPRKRFS